jgi:hypothetical protein
VNSSIPVDVGFLGGNGAVFESGGATEGINELGEFCFGVDIHWKTCGQDAHTPWEGRHLDRLTGEGAVARLQGAGLIDEGLLGERGCPGDGEDIAGEDAGGIDGLAELPIGNRRGTAKGVEIGLGALADWWPWALVQDSAQRT